MSQIQRFVNRVAGTAHREVPTSKVSNGCWSFYAGSDQGSNFNYYTDERLIAAGEELGIKVLDNIIIGKEGFWNIKNTSL